jgi:DNA-binding transcriptional ArsR family regulator
MNNGDLTNMAMELSGMLRILGNHLRLLSVCFIGEKELSVQDLAGRLGTTQSNLSQHLAKLKLANILDCRRDGNMVFYRIKDRRILKLIDVLQATFCDHKDLKRS